MTRLLARDNAESELNKVLKHPGEGTPGKKKSVLVCEGLNYVYFLDGIVIGRWSLN